MNTTRILKSVAERAPQAKNLHIRDEGKGVFSLIAEVAGMTRCVQFTSCGIYGETAFGWQLPQSDDAIAGQLAGALK